MREAMSSAVSMVRVNNRYGPAGDAKSSRSPYDLPLETFPNLTPVTPNILPTVMAEMRNLKTPSRILFILIEAD